MNNAPERFEVEPADDGTTISAVLRRRCGVAWSVAKRWCAQGQVRVDGAPVTDPGHRVTTGREVEVNPSAPARNAATGDGSLVLDRARILHIDAQVLVFDKPPGINTVPFDDGERGALVDRLGVQLHRWRLAPANAPLFVVHRLDRETSGALVFGRTWLAKRHLAGLFRKHDVERVYLALVHGHLRDARRIESVLLEDRGDGLRGSARGRTASHVGQRAVTHVRPIVTLPGEGGATLVACELETGRQHQIRIHLSEAGHPVIGDRVYIRKYAGVALPAPRVMLHARTLGFTHPARPDEDPVRYESPLPDDFAAVARRLGWNGELPPR